VALEEHAFLEDDHGRFDIADHPGTAPQLHTLAAQDVAHHLAADQDDAGPNRGVDHALLTDDQGVVGGDLAGEAAVEHHGAAEGVLALDLGSLVDEGGEVVALDRAALAAMVLLPEHPQGSG
jgi:hypothetical protein